MPEDMITSSGPARVDVISFDGGRASGFGSVAQRLLTSGMNVQSLRTMDVLTKEEWLAYDTAVVQVARQRLVGVADLLDNGLRFDLPNGLGTTILQWDRASDMDPAEVSMSGITEGVRDRMLFGLQTLPIPIVHKDFQINIRTLEASRRRGEPLDTMQAALAGRLVSEGVEGMLFTGSSISVPGHYPSGSFTIYGYLNAPNRVNTSLTSDWKTAVAGPPSLGETIVTDIVTMLGALNLKHMYGPFMLYVPMAVFNALGEDYKQYSDRTILDRISSMANIAGVRGSEFLPTSPKTQVVLAQMTPDVVDEVVGLQPTTVMWSEYGGLQMNFKVLAIMVPRVKSDYKLQCGIAVGTQP